MTTHYINEKDARKFICEIGRRMYQRGFVAANDGNISVLISPTEILCTPTGISKGFMTEDQLIVIDLSGKKLRGNLEPSSEMKMHIKIYEKNSSVKSVVHAHPVNATALAVAGIPLTEPILTESIVVLGPIPLAEYATAGTDEVPDSIEPYCNDYNGVLMANHGAAVWSDDLMKSWYLMESLEHTAEIYIKSKFIIGNLNLISDKNIDKLKERYGIKNDK